MSVDFALRKSALMDCPELSASPPFVGALVIRCKLAVTRAFAAISPARPQTGVLTAKSCLRVSANRISGLL